MNTSLKQALPEADGAGAHALAFEEWLAIQEEFEAARQMDFSCRDAALARSEAPGADV